MPAARVIKRHRSTKRRARRGGHGKRLHHAWRMLLAAPRLVRYAVIGAMALTGLAAADLAYQVGRKPTEMLFLWPGASKAPTETWRDYGALFQRNSTAAVSPELLAALAQVEGAGDPTARTYWHWRFTWNPLEIYKPASSSVGMYQMTDAAFSEASRYCIRHHAVVEDCWFNGLYTRILPSHAVELAAIFLDRNLAAILSAGRNEGASAEQKQELAAVIYLCGPGMARSFARRGFRLT